MTEFAERYRWLIIGAFAVPLLVALGFLLRERTDDPEPLQVNLAPAEIRVYIIGAVKHSGVYPAEEGDRWIDVLEAAGGPTADADLARVNLARRVHDEDQIVVPRRGDTGSSGGTSAADLVNINSAGPAELDALPGIGEVRSQRIVDSRTADGLFANTEELVTRDIIPQSVYDEIKDLITVGP